MALFEVGESVAWVMKNRPDLIGTVVAVMPSDSEIEELALYDVQFDFGTVTVHGSQLKARGKHFSA